MSIPSENRGTKLSFNERRRIAAAKKQKPKATVAYKGQTSKTLGPRQNTVPNRVEVVTSPKSSGSTATTKTSKSGATYQGQTDRTLGPKVPVTRSTPSRNAKPATTKTSAQLTTEQKMRDAAAKIKAIQARTQTSSSKPGSATIIKAGGNAAPVVAGKASSPATRATMTPAKGGNSSLKPGAPGGPKKSAAQLATEAKMRNAANAAAANGKLNEYLKRATDSVKAEDLPALNNLKRQMDSAIKGEAKAQAEIEGRATKGKESLTSLFGGLNDFIGQQGEAYGKDMDQFQAQTRGTYADLENQLRSQYQGAEANSNAELERLGLTNAVPNANQGMNRDKNFLTGLAQVDGQFAGGTMDRMQSGFDRILGLQRNNATAEGASRIGQLETQSQASLADLEYALQQNLGELRGKEGDLVATQGNRVQELMRAMQDQQFERDREAQQIAFQQQMATKQFGLEQAQVNAAMQPQAPTYMDQLQAAKLEAEIQRIMQGGAASAGAFPTAPVGPAPVPGPAGPLRSPSTGVDPRRRSDGTPIGGL